MNEINSGAAMAETGLEIAVIGMAGRFPGARNITEFWNNLKNGIESITFFSAAELEEAGCDPGLVRSPNYVKAMGYLQDYEYFDGSFFGYTPTEAEVIDPQIRFFHECTWEALEDAGYESGSYPGRIGLYAGGESNALWETLTSLSPIVQYLDPFTLSNLNNKDFLSMRISYKFNLSGPAFTVHTACSTSLVAIHLAVQGLLNGECEMALAGGVRVSTPGKAGYFYKEGMINSPDGHCRAFDAGAKGIVPGDGVGVVVLKPLEDAAANGDNIYAVIKGSAINNDGIRKVGFHAPSIKGQAEVICTAFYTAELEPGSIGYIETHGTGTELGDSVEIEALKLAFNNNPQHKCAIGSVKTNIGHLGSAAGAASFIKTVLILKNRLIPPSLHFEKPNPKIEFKNSPFYVNTQLKAWPEMDFPPRAGVSSFGIGGSNAHIILEAAPMYLPSTREAPDRPFQLLLLSAHTPAALEKMTQNLANYLKENPDISLADAAYTLQVGRKRFTARRKLLCSDIAETVNLLTRITLQDAGIYTAQVGEDRDIVFMFPGLGPQYVNMGAGLYRSEPFFREEMDRCFNILKDLGVDNIKEILYPEIGAPGVAGAPGTEIENFEAIQLVMFIFEYSLAKLIMHWGIRPFAMIGYSFGEYVTACIAGVFSLEDILKLLVARGRLISRLPEGMMLSVPLPVETVHSLLPNELSIGIDNESSCVVSGPKTVVEIFAKQMKENKVLCTPIESPYAAHSQMMDHILAEFKEELAKITLNIPQIPYISTVSGNWIAAEDVLSPDYWVTQLRSTVYFVRGIRQILQESKPLFLEMGPGRDMSALVNREITDKSSPRPINLVRHRGVQKDKPDEYYLLDKIGRLWLYGINIDWQAFHSDYPGRKRYRVSLPAYPFEKQRYWKIMDDYKAGKYSYLTGGHGYLEDRISQQENSGHSDPVQDGKNQEVQELIWYPRPQLSTLYAGPQNDIQRALVAIWQRLFGIKEIGVQDDFFELGGDSLKAINVLSLLHKETDKLVPLPYFFDNPTIEQVAAYSMGEETGFAAIQPLEKKEYYPLSSAQKRMYFFQQVDLESIAYNNVMVNVIEGALDTGKLIEIFKKLIHRHDSLRTSFIEVNGELVQRIHDQVKFDIRCKDIAADKSGQHGRTKTSLNTEIIDLIRTFDLTKAPLLRVGLVKVGEQEHILVVDMHHIISDGTSIAILIEEFGRLYQGEELPGLLLQYKDYAVWQNRELGGTAGLLAQQRDFWLNEFAGEIPVLDLPYDYVRPVARSFSGKVLPFEIGSEETLALKRLASGQGATLYMVLLSLTGIFLAKLSGQETVVVGTPIAGRTHADLGRIIGMFVNTLAMKTGPVGEKVTLDYLNEVKEKALNALSNQDYQYEELVEHLAIDRNSGHNPLFDTMFALQNVEIRPMAVPSLNLKPYPYEQGIAKFDLSFQCVENGDILSFSLEYSTELFKDETAERLIGYYQKILSQLIKKATGKISEIEITSDEEKKQLLFQFNETAMNYPVDKTIQQLFAEQVEKTPDAIALVGANRHLRVCPNKMMITYHQLNEQAGQLAGSLIERGIQPGDIVAIMIERSLEMIIGILGILKSGAAYLPLNPKNPSSRTEYMLKDSGAKLLAIANGANGLEGKKVRRWEGERRGLQHSNLAYLIYTSGSTGNPKGVPITHANFSPLVHWGYRFMGISERDRFLQNLSYFFDWSVWEIFLALTTGAGLYLTGEDVLLDGQALSKFINEKRITVLHITPSQFQALVESAELKSLKHLCLGAEKLTYDLVKRSMEIVPGDCRIYNMYGPTEATIITSVLEIKRNSVNKYESLSSVPIGVPVGNAQLYILDKYSNVCPVNIAGELYIGGDGVSMGYLNNPELTAEKFNRSYKAYILYRTGDLARWLEDGVVEFLGRIDQQVKIRGYRIELGEIENCLINYPGVKGTVVLVREDGGDNYLCAYIVSERERECEIAVLREFVQKRVPAYMVPSYFVQLEKIPLTANGKIDREALPEPELTTGKAYIAPINEIEMKLVTIWSEVLRIDKDKIGTNDNFFSVGGHSLKAITLASAIHKEFNVKVPQTEVFLNPTVKGLANYISKAVKTRFESIEPVEKKEYYVLSRSQKRLYILHQVNPLSTAYNMPQVIPLREDLDSEKLSRAFICLIERHESLRTSFQTVVDHPVQKVHEPAEVEFKLPYFEAAIFSQAVERFIRPFDLSRPPLLRAGLLKLAGQPPVLLVDMHHIISDGVSMEILTRDFLFYYQTGSIEMLNETLPALRIHYKDFAEWQNSESQLENIKQQEIYWLHAFEGKIPMLNLPWDFPRPQIQTFEGDAIRFTLEKELLTTLGTIASKEGVTMYMLFLALFNVFLARLCGQEDIVIGIASAGRHHADLEQIIGMFVNTLALRNFPFHHKTFNGFLQDVKQRTLAAFENQDYPFEGLVEKVIPQRNIGHNPLFDIMFNFVELSGAAPAPGPSAELFTYGINASKFDMTFAISKIGANDFYFNIRYSTQLFKNETIRELIQVFKEVTAAAAANPGVKIAEIKMNIQLKIENALSESYDELENE